MENKDKNVFDKFLDNYERANVKQEYEKVYQRPSKFKSIVGFSFSFIIFILLLFMFVFDWLYFFLLLFDVAICIFYGINLFTEKGIGLPKYVMVEKKEIQYKEEMDDTEDKDNKKEKYDTRKRY